MESASRFSIAAALACVYIIWGSTYLAILWTLETLPPFFMAGIRFLCAGALLLAFRLWRGDAAPSRREWLAGFATGTLMLLGGNGSVVWAEQQVASGVVALVVGCAPIFIVLFEWMRRDGRRPTGRVVAGLALGLAGVALLVAPSAGHVAISPWRLLVLLVGSCCWAGGSLLSREIGLPRSPLLATSLQMLGGGVALALTGALAGEFPRIDLAAVSMKSWLSLIYLMLFGSIVAFSCYAWLLRVTKPAIAATYAFVNPVVAVALGAWLASEPITPSMVAATLLIIAAVVAITRGGAAST
jgi:drug/metabolite transporter (DMT)-like permease